MDGKANGAKPAKPVIGARGTIMDWHGLTKRELFAAMAMQGFAAGICMGALDADVAGKDAVRMADALLAALAQAQTNEGES